MAKTIGLSDQQKGKACAYCGDKFGSTEFVAHLTSFGADKIFCHVCQKKSFIYTTDNKMLRWVFLSIAWLVGIIIAFPGLLYIPVIFQEYQSTKQILKASSTLAVISPLTGIIVGRYVLHVFDWIDAKVVKLEDQPSMQFIN